jgi:uncharacterized protein (TIGR02679 family)
MEHLKRITGAYTDEGTAYIVENQMVFSYLQQKMRPGAALLCTSGQLRSASRELISLLLQSGTRICYSGDLDPEGMLIADKLWQSAPERIRIWRMTAQDYRRSISGEPIEERRLGMLDLLKNPDLQETAQQIRRITKAGYQENILQDLAGDVSCR